jgi:hypothetical protein
MHLPSTSNPLSTTTGHLPHSALELHCPETTTFASQPEAHLQAALVGQFLENRDIIEQSTFQVEYGGI